MKYQEIMSVLSQSGLGALVMEADSRILAVNQAGDALLHGAGKLEGKLLSEIALPLSMQSENRCMQALFSVNICCDVRRRMWKTCRRIHSWLYFAMRQRMPCRIF